MRHEAWPDARYQQTCFRSVKPTGKRCNDVRMGMRGEHIPEPLGREEACHCHVELVIGRQRSARFEQDTVPFANNQELVGLHRLRMSLIRKVGKHQANVFATVEKLSRHATLQFVGSVMMPGRRPDMPRDQIAPAIVLRKRVRKIELVQQCRIFGLAAGYDCPLRHGRRRCHRGGASMKPAC